MKRLSIIYFIFGLLFGCKAMDYTLVKEDDKAVQIQYYNFKPYFIEYVNVWGLNEKRHVSYQIHGDTLVLNYGLSYFRIKNEKESDSEPLNDEVHLNCATSMSFPRPLIERGKPDDFYVVNFPILEIDNVAREDLGKWYRSFLVIQVNVIEKENIKQQYYFEYSRSIFNQIGYARP